MNFSAKVSISGRFRCGRERVKNRYIYPLVYISMAQECGAKIVRLEEGPRFRFLDLTLLNTRLISAQKTLFGHHHYLASLESRDQNKAP